MRTSSLLSVAVAVATLSGCRFSSVEARIEADQIRAPLANRFTASANGD